MREKWRRRAAAKSITVTDTRGGRRRIAALTLGRILRVSENDDSGGTTIRAWAEGGFEQPPVEAVISSRKRSRSRNLV